MAENNFEKLFGGYPVVPMTVNTKSDDIKNTVSYPVVAGIIDDKNFYHQLRAHYNTSPLQWSNAFNSNHIFSNLNNVVFEYIKTPYKNFVEIMNLQEKPFYMNFSNSSLSLEQTSYPIGLRYFDTQNDLVIFERPPFKMSIDFTPFKARASSKNRRKYEIKDLSIWVPWTVYVFNLTSKNQLNVMVYFNNKPLSSLEDVIFPALLPNVFNDGRICFGDYHNSLNDFHHKMVKNKKYSLKSIFNEALSYFYSGGWNSDIVPHTPYPDFLRVYTTTRSMKSTIKDEKALSIYERASTDAQYYDVDKMRSNERYGYYRGTEVEQYMNALSIWSQYSLEETMYLFGKYYDSAREHYKNSQSYNENYNAKPGITLENLINMLHVVRYDNQELKRHKLLAIFNTFINGNNIQNPINYEGILSSSSQSLNYDNIHEVNFGSGTALRRVYYVNPLTNEPHHRNKTLTQKEIHDILDYIITPEKQTKISIPQNETADSL